VTLLSVAAAMMEEIGQHPMTTGRNFDSGVVLTVYGSNVPSPLSPLNDQVQLLVAVG